MSYTQTLRSVGGLQKQKTTSIQFTTFPRTQNIHVFDFEKAQEERARIQQMGAICEWNSNSNNNKTFSS
jgi:hypothetical protein